jgi:hypothetical protein
MTTTPTLDAAECRALLDVIATHGRRWRAALDHAWQTGRYTGIHKDHVPTLQSLRNRIGPSGLARITTNGVIKALERLDAAPAMARAYEPRYDD